MRLCVLFDVMTYLANSINNDKYNKFIPVVSSVQICSYLSADCSKVGRVSDLWIGGCKLSLQAASLCINNQSFF